MKEDLALAKDLSCKDPEVPLSRRFLAYEPADFLLDMH